MLVNMHPAVKALVNSLSRGYGHQEGRHEAAPGTIGKLARVYEIARNALEYRADHLVRRAAIERILRREVALGYSEDEQAEDLLTELKWAMYMTEVEERKVPKEQVTEILKRYTMALSSREVSRDWVIGVASAEIEEKLNPNTDYHQFTNFAFHALKSRVQMPAVENVDLVLFVAVDKVYSQSDDQQVSYHLFKLIRGQTQDEANAEKVLIETWRHYMAAVKSPVFNVVSAFVRKQMAPLVLLRDVYFAAPTEFVNIISDGNKFTQVAWEVLEDQLSMMQGRIRTATVRSLVYVFLTKMLLVFLLELPVERALVGQVEYLSLGINLAFPVVFMWLLAATIKLPEKSVQERLVARSWQVVADFESKPERSEVLYRTAEGAKTKFVVYYIFYALLFMLTFLVIAGVLIGLGFNLANIVVFLFFLCVVSFFAYRIKQTSQMYSYNPKATGRSNFVEAVMLPIVVVGRLLSSGVSRLNFLVFIFDFVLEAPYKIILKFLDNWLAFLSRKQEEAVG